MPKDPTPSAAPPTDIDVLILGAGINGAGTFRDLCEQGLACVIGDKGDFGSGTSAAPSRMIHGGIKYLETGQFRLVAQSTLERNLLLRNAPHYVTPLHTVIPLFSWLRGIPSALRTLFGSTTAPRSRGAVLIKIGLAVYDFYGRRQRVMPRHALWSRARALREIPGLTPEITAAAAYYDAKVSHPERLVLELVRDGLAASPASQALNHATLAGTDGRVVHLTAADGRPLALRPRIVLNAGGPWIDRINAALGAPSALIGGTKGSHIILDHPALLAALKGRMIYFEADDGRICLVYGYLGRVLVGSTDIRDDNPDTVRCEEDEIAYFLKELRELLPALTFDEGQILYTYSGIRPLPRSDAAIAGLISRDHSAPVAEPEGARQWPILSLVGGKWTTFRGFAEEVAETVLARLGHARRVSTQGLPIGGGRDYPADPAALGGRHRRPHRLRDRPRRAVAGALWHRGAGDPGPRRAGAAAAGRPARLVRGRDRLDRPQRDGGEAGRHHPAPHRSGDHRAADGTGAGPDRRDYRRRSGVGQRPPDRRSGGNA